MHRPIEGACPAGRVPLGGMQADAFVQQMREEQAQGRPGPFGPSQEFIHGLLRDHGHRGLAVAVTPTHLKWEVHGIKRQAVFKVRIAQLVRRRDSWVLSSSKRAAASDFD